MVMKLRLRYLRESVHVTRWQDASYKVFGNLMATLGVDGAYKKAKE